MATQLSLYNGALLELGERTLVTTADNVEPRRLLDVVYATAVRQCLEQGFWKFALRTTKLAYDPSFTPPFGYTRQFVKPADCVRLSKLCSDEFFNAPLLAYAEEAGFWFSNLDTIYVSYVSNDPAYGGNLALWPESFVLYVQRYLGSRIVSRLEQSKVDTEAITKMTQIALVDARSKDALEGPTTFPPSGSWVNSRREGWNIGRRDGGRRGGLIG